MKRSGCLNHLKSRKGNNSSRLVNYVIMLEINTDPSPTYHKESGAPMILETRNSELIMLEIEREKARKEKPTDYISVVEAKLVELLNYIL